MIIERGKLAAGYRGQLAFDYYLRLIQNESCFVLNNIRLRLNDAFFQMDTLLLTNQFLLIIEVKNVIGDLIFDFEFQQLIKERESIREVYNCPIQQVMNQHQKLHHWLRLHKMFNIPIYSIVVLTNTKCFIKEVKGDRNFIKSKLMRSTRFNIFFEDLTSSVSNEVLMDSETNQLAKLFVQHHTPQILNIYERHDISQQTISRGVICHDCQYFFTLYSPNSTCPTCSRPQKSLIDQNISDYSLLVSPTFANVNIRDFLNVPSRYTMKRLLKSSPQVKYSNSTYHYPLHD